jgi:hypothetical protein
MSSEEHDCVFLHTTYFLYDLMYSAFTTPNELSVNDLYLKQKIRCLCILKCIWCSLTHPYTPAKIMSVIATATITTIAAISAAAATDTTITTTTTTTADATDTTTTTTTTTTAAADVAAMTATTTTADAATTNTTTTTRFRTAVSMRKPGIAYNTSLERNTVSTKPK